MRTLHCLHLLFVVETVAVELPHLFVAHRLALPAGLNWHLHVLCVATGSIISVIAAVVIAIVTSTLVWNFIAKFFSHSEAFTAP